MKAQLEGERNKHRPFIPPQNTHVHIQWREKRKKEENRHLLSMRSVPMDIYIYMLHILYFHEPS